jgi:hypothetical protein
MAARISAMSTKENGRRRRGRAGYSGTRGPPRSPRTSTRTSSTAPRRRASSRNRASPTSSTSKSSSTAGSSSTQTSTSPTLRCRPVDRLPRGARRAAAAPGAAARHRRRRDLMIASGPGLAGVRSNFGLAARICADRVARAARSRAARLKPPVRGADITTGTCARSTAAEGQCEASPMTEAETRIASPVATGAARPAASSARPRSPRTCA